MVKYHVGAPVEELKVAFCLTGSSRSLPTVPVLRGFKKNVLQSRRYVAAAFAALSLSPNVPGVHDSNLTLVNKLSNVLFVRRAMQRLQPELKSWVIINSSEVVSQYGQRSCPAGGGLQPTTHTTPTTTMWLTSLYAMQRCYSLVRGYESGRVDHFAFDYVVRLRPDQIFPTEHFQMGPAIMRRDNPKLRTVALTIAIAGVTGLLLNASFLPWIGASQSAAVGLGECS